MTKETQWLTERRTILGGSDASAILGLNPWQTNVDVWEAKVNGKQFEINNMDAINYGKKAEKHLTNLFKLDYSKYKVITNPYKIIRHPLRDYLGGTLDGELIEKETGRKGILEIKTANILNSMSREKWKDQIPSNYMCQILHYLLVTGYDYAVLKAQLKTDYSGDIRIQTNHYFIERVNVQEDLNYLLEKEVEFWDKYVLTKKRPPLILPNI